MGQLLFGKPKTKWTDPKTRPGYVNPFVKKESAQEKKMKELQKWEALARMIKKRGSKSSVKEIAVELYEAEQRRKNI